MKLARAVLAVVLLGALLAGGPAHAARIATASYTYGPFGDVAAGIGFTICDGMLHNGPPVQAGHDNWASGCFPVQAGETSATVHVADSAFDRVSFSIDYQDMEGHFTSPIMHGCDTTTIPIPQGVSAIFVHVNGVVYSSSGPLQAYDVETPGCVSPSFATSGTITASFS